MTTIAPLQHHRHINEAPMTQDGDLHFRITLDDSQARERASAFRHELESVGRTARDAGGELQSAFAGIGRTMAATFGTAAITSFARSIISVRAEMQGLEASFTTLLGSSSKGKEMMRELTEFGASTPMELPDLAKAAQTMLSFGISSEKVVPIIKQMGDVSGGSGEKLQSLALAFSQMSSTGHLMGQDLLQMINAGFNPLAEIARTTGRSMQELKEAMSAGAISVQMVEEAFRSATSQGGLFYQNLEAQSETLRGQLGALSDAYQQMLNSIGESTDGVISGAVSGLKFLIEHYETIGKVLLTLVATYGAYKAVVIATAAAQRIAAWAEGVRYILQTTTALTRATQAQILFNTVVKANPYVLLASVIAGVVTAFVAFASSTDKATTAQRALSEVEQETSRQFAAESARVKSLSSAIHDNTLSVNARREAVNRLRAIIPDYNAQISDEGRLIRENTKAIDDYLARLKQQIRLKAYEGKLVESMQKEINKEEEVKKQQRIVKKYSDPKRKSKPASNLGEALVELFAGKDAAESELQKLQGELDAQRAATKSLLEGAAEAKRTLSKVSATAKQAPKATAPKGEVKAHPARTTDKPKDDRLQRLRDQEQAELAEQSLLLQQQEARVALIDAGWQREEAVLNLNQQKRLLAYKRLRTQLIEEQRQESKDPISVTEDSLSDRRRGILREQQRLHQQQELKEQQEYWLRTLQEAETYQEKRLRLQQDYSQKREALYKHDSEGRRQGYHSNASERNEQELNRQEREALEALDKEVVQRSESFRAWAEQITALSLEQLQRLLTEAQRQLQTLEASPSVDSTKLAEGRAKIAQLETAIERVTARDALDPDARSRERWEEFTRTIDRGARSFDELGRSISGTAGQLLQAVGQVASSTSSAISGLVSLTESSAQAMSATATASARAMKTIERASVIIAIVSAALQVAQTIASLFDSDKQRDQEIKSLQSRIDRLQWEIDHSSASQLERQVNSLASVRNALSEASQSAQSFTSYLRSGGLVAALMRRDMDILQRAAERMVATYTQLDYSANKAAGRGRYQQARQEMLLMAQQQIALSQQMDAERSKKKSDGDKIESYRQRIAELGEKQAEVLNKLTEDVLGGTSEKLAEQLGDALSEAFQRGESAADSFNKRVGDILRSLVQRQLTEELLQKPMLQLFDKYKRAFTAQQFDPSAIIGMTSELSNDLRELGQRVTPAFAEVMKGLDSQLSSLSHDITGATKRGIATASQESVDENNGLLRSMQGLSAEMQRDLRGLRSIASSQLTHLERIDQHTAHLEGISRDLQTMKRTLSDIETRGLKSR